MSFRVRKSIKLGKGVRLNLGKKGASLSFGVKGARHSISTSGRRTTSIGIPGTGVYYVKSASNGKRISKNTSSTMDSNDASLEVEQFNDSVDYITNFHSHASFAYNWNEIKEKKPPYDILERGPNEIQAIKKKQDYNPNFLDKLFSTSYEKKMMVLEEKIKAAKQVDEALYANWQEENKLAESMLMGDIKAYNSILKDKDILEEMDGIVSDLNFNILNSDFIVAKCSIEISNIVSQKYPTLTKTGKLSIRTFTKTDYYEIIKNTISSITIRLARNFYGLLPIENILIDIEDISLETQTGNKKDQIILSILFDRNIMEGLNFQSINPFDALNNFEHKVKFLKTKGFQAIDPINKKA